MPLDSAEFFANPTLAKLWQVERLLATEDQWCKGALRDRKGRHCLAGAIADADGRRELTKPILQAARKVSGRHYWRIQSFNDHPCTTHQDVLRVIARARMMILDDLTGADEPGWEQKLREMMARLLPATTGDRMQLYGLAADTMPTPVLVHHNPDAERSRLAKPVGFAAEYPAHVETE